MAIDILLILSISAEAERIFLGGCQTIVWDCISLGSTNIESTECLKSWLRSNITDDRLVATDVVVEALDCGVLMEQLTPTTPSQRSPD
jgi:hypothetical protein